jgi:hypothetical protein
VGGPDDEAPATGPPPVEEPRARAVLAEPGARFIDPCRRWEETAHLVIGLPRYVREEMPLHLDPTEWRTGFLAVHERELPPELYADLRENTPQAYLRDLHRVVKPFSATLEPVEGSRVVGGWAEALDEARAARVREPLPVVEPTTGAVREEQQRRRALLAERWQPAIPDDAERRKVTLYPDFSGEDE